jgi:hypothetical protein
MRALVSAVFAAVGILAALILAAPAAAGLAPADRAAINRTLDAFVKTAVRRENVAASYDLVTPQLRGGETRRQWTTGDIPVYPFPARGTSWHGWTLDYALRNEVAFELVLQPRRGSKEDPISFSASVRRVHGRWLVDSFYPAAIYVTKESRVIGPRDFGPAPVTPAAGESALGAAWIAVPAALGALILLVPLGFLAFNAVRHRRRRPAPEERERYDEFWARLRARSTQSS